MPSYPATPPLATVAILGLGLYASACGNDAAGTPERAPTEASAPSRYVLPGTGVFPEGVAADEDYVFASASSDGTVYRARVEDSSMRVFLPAGADGREAALGLRLEEEALYVAGGRTGMAWVYDSETGVLRQRYTTPTPAPGDSTFVNDVALLPDGRAVFTDSFRPILWRGAAPASDGSGVALEPWVDLTAAGIAYGPGFNLNGLAFVPSAGALVIAQTNTGQLWRVDATSGGVTEVALAGAFERGGDGMRYEASSERLYVVDGGGVSVLDLAGDARSATVVDRVVAPAFEGPTGVELAAGDELLVVNAQFGARADSISPRLPFDVVRVTVPQ